MGDTNNRASQDGDALKGILWMVSTGLCFVGVIGLVKLMGDRIPPAQASFLRFLFGLVLFIPLLFQLDSLRFSARQWGLFAARGFVHSIAVGLWFFAMTQISMAEVTAMNYMAPVYVTIGAAIFLGEKLAFRRIMAIAVGLIGAAIILRPGFRDLSPGHIAMLVCAFFFAGSYLIAKILSAELSAPIIVAFMSLFVTIGLAPAALLNWVPPRIEELGILLLVAALASFAHYAMTRAFAAAPVSVTQPVTFLQLLWSVLLGAAFFAEPIDPWVVLGGALILGATTFIAIRESQLKKRRPEVSAPRT